MRLDVRYAFRPKQNSTRTAVVMDHFGIGFEQGEHVVAAGVELPVRPGDVVLFTGASGSGKSSLLRAAAAALRAAGCDSVDQPAESGCDRRRSESGRRESVEPPVVLDVNELALGDRTLIDSFDAAPAETMQLLSACGLGEAHLMLRTPAELSDGQRYRLRLALGLAALSAESENGRRRSAERPAGARWLAADEFTATLDRTLAKVVAFNLRRLADRTGTGFLLATTHEDITDDLDPDVHVRCRLDGEVQIECRRDERGRRESAEQGAVVSGLPIGSSPARKKKEPSRSRTSCGSARRPGATGRTFLGGITAATTSG